MLGNRPSHNNNNSSQIKKFTNRYSKQAKLSPPMPPSRVPQPKKKVLIASSQLGKAVAKVLHPVQPKPITKRAKRLACKAFMKRQQVPSGMRLLHTMYLRVDARN